MTCTFASGVWATGTRRAATTPTTRTKTAKMAGTRIALFNVFPPRDVWFCELRLSLRVHPDAERLPGLRPPILASPARERSLGGRVRSQGHPGPLRGPAIRCRICRQGLDGKAKMRRARGRPVRLER